MRILTFSSLYPSSAKPRHGLFVAARLRELRKRHGFEAQVLAPVPWFPFKHPRFGEYGAWARTPSEEVWQGQPVAHPRYLMVPKFGMARQPDAMARAATRWLEGQGARFDLIDAHYFYPDGVAAAQLSRRFGIPLMITARGSDLNLIGQDPAARARMLEACETARACVGVSQALVDVLASWGVPAHKLHVIRNGVDLEQFAPQSPAEARQQLGLPDGPLLFTAGNLLELKGHALIIDAMPQLRAQWPGLRLCIAGEGPERAALEAQIATLGLQGAVQLLGSRDQAELAAWYSAADAFVLPSSREGLPNVLLEALSCGTPAVATAVGGIPEVLAGHPELGSLLPERSAAAIAQTVHALLAEPRDRRCIRTWARRYSWDDSAARLAALMRTIAGDDPHA